jgi:serine protease Do
MNTLPRTVAETPIGKKVKLAVIRDGAKKEFTVKIGELTEEKEQEVASGDQSENLGMVVNELTPEMAEHLNVKPGSGVVVTDVAGGGAADEAGIRRGDVIKEINKQPIKSVKGYSQAMKKAMKGDTIRLWLQRGKNSIYLTIKP